MDSTTSSPTNGATEAAAVAVSPVSWRPRQAMSMHEWITRGRRLGMLGRHVGWWIGDWLRYGNAAYGERYARAAKVTGYDTQTLMNMVYVASQVDVPRRRETLSWSHHAEVAPLAEEAQEQWLARAEQERLSVRDLREEIRRARHGLSVAQDRDAGDEPEGAPMTCPGCGYVFHMAA